MTISRRDVGVRTLAPFTSTAPDRGVVSLIAQLSTGSGLKCHESVSARHARPYIDGHRADGFQPDALFRRHLWHRRLPHRPPRRFSVVERTDQMSSRLDRSISVTIMDGYCLARVTIMSLSRSAARQLSPDVPKSLPLRLRRAPSHELGFMPGCRSTERDRPSALRPSSP